MCCMFLRRLGLDPHANGERTSGTYGCPDIWELTDGDFAIIGQDITGLATALPNSASCGPDERIVLIPRKVLVGARADIPSSV
jgi:hypothetical protein